MTAAAHLRLIEGGRPDDLVWSPEQRQALDAIANWRRRVAASSMLQPAQPFFYLAGFAGTGKSTLLREIASAEPKTEFLAFAGKAAGIMRRKGAAGASTIDKAIYHHPFEWNCQRCDAPPCTDPCRHAWQEFLGKQINPGCAVARARLVVVDEVSMVDEAMGRDLLSFGTPVLVVGDPGQLPPIAGGGFFTAGRPDAFLSEIHRQAVGNPIIDLATTVRQGRLPAIGQYGESAVLQRRYDGDLSDFDAVICGTNAMRRRLNHQIRDELGFHTELPVAGEKLLVLRNRHAKGLMNGEVVTVLEVGEQQDGFLRMTVASDDGEPVGIKAPVDLLLSDDSNGSGLPGDPCTWGYCLTAHKAQGSQWNSVLVVDESDCFREDRWRWLYTAITRAVERVTIVRR